MSWSFSVVGNPEEVEKKFDETREQCASWGMIEAELRDIDAAKYFAMSRASAYGRVSVSASGSWAVYGPNDERNQFGSVRVTIDTAPAVAEGSAS